MLGSRGVPGWGATLAAAPVLFDPRQLDIEHSVMSDTLATLLMLAALAVLPIRRPSWSAARRGRQNRTPSAATPPSTESPSPDPQLVENNDPPRAPTGGLP